MDAAIVVGPAIGLVGGWLAARWSAKRDLRGWARDQRTTVYGDALAAIRRVLDDLTEFINATGHRQAAINTKIQEDTASLTDVMNRASIVGSDRAGELGRSIASFCRRTVDAVFVEQRVPIWAVGPLRMNLAHAHAEFVYLSRRELGVTRPRPFRSRPFTGEPWWARWRDKSLSQAQLAVFDDHGQAGIRHVPEAEGIQPST